MGSKRSEAERKQIADVVCEAMRGGLSMRKACIEAEISVSCFMVWVAEDEKIQEQYACAREALIDKIADETIDIADEPVGMTDNGATDSGAVAKQRLQVDTRKWLLSKLAPKKYGEKVENTMLGPDGGPMQMTGTFNVNFKGVAK